MWIWVWIPIRLGGFYNENKRSPSISSPHPVFEIKCKMKMQSSNRKIIKLLQIFIFMWFFTQKQNFISIIPFHLEGNKGNLCKITFSARREWFGGEKKCLSEIIFSNQWFRILSPKPHLKKFTDFIRRYHWDQDFFYSVFIVISFNNKYNFLLSEFFYIWR